MALSDHLRELRARILKVALTLLVALVVALFFFDQLFDLVYGPYEEAVARLEDKQTLATTTGAGGGLMLYLKLCGFAALVATAPVWLYQIWAFIMPGLHAHERKWTRVFGAVATPLFLLGIWIGYVTLPKGLEILIGFNPDGITNILEFSGYLQFFTRTMLVFGIAIPIAFTFIVIHVLADIARDAGEESGLAALAAEHPGNGILLD